MKRTALLLVAVLVVTGVAAALAGFWLSRPRPLVAAVLPPHTPNLQNGELLFHAGGCASCHGAELQGGLELVTAFGTFRVPNITPDPQAGIGDWSALDLVNAMQRGLSPDGRHYYPAFPYGSYTRMTHADLLDLKAYLDSFPPADGEVAGHDLNFPWNLRRGIGLWKRLYLDDAPIAPVAETDYMLQRGRYLVEAVGHCGECHTPRGPFGGLDQSRWLAGGASAEGEGKVPNITPHEQGLADWSVKDIERYLRSGFTPDYDMVGGAMVEVQENLARLGDADRAAIAAYLKSIPARSE